MPGDSPELELELDINNGFPETLNVKPSLRLNSVFARVVLLAHTEKKSPGSTLPMRMGPV